MRIGELSEHTGASPRSLRYYEQCGLLTGHRRPGGHRTYDETDIAQVRFIQGLLSTGLSTSVIRELLHQCNQETSSGTSRTTTILIEQRERLDNCIEKLLRARVQLDEFIAEVHAPDLSTRA
ncbi:MerR family transcriptional regulator [Streptomyces sp. NPDC056987]|uniref:MerR family transcriptional regulator n=1 Tax=Streptomyces sp. NPDC056987 TaxID=3345988 RepID=UPI0036324B64